MTACVISVVLFLSCIVITLCHRYLQAYINCKNLLCINSIQKYAVRTATFSLALPQMWVLLIFLYHSCSTLSALHSASGMLTTVTLVLSEHLVRKRFRYRSLCRFHITSIILFCLMFGRICNVCHCVLCSILFYKCCVVTVFPTSELFHCQLYGDFTPPFSFVNGHESTVCVVVLT